MRIVAWSRHLADQVRGAGGGRGVSPRVGLGAPSQFCHLVPCLTPKPAGKG